jgi:hypothetical protein
MGYVQGMDGYERPECGETWRGHTGNLRMLGPALNRGTVRLARSGEYLGKAGERERLRYKIAPAPKEDGTGALLTKTACGGQSGGTTGTREFVVHASRDRIAAPSIPPTVDIVGASNCCALTHMSRMASRSEVGALRLKSLLNMGIWKKGPRHHRQREH